ncbi:unnamed protein product [Chilo suppressalis]|uniref:Asteroid domain-containing protein n=1 Tax=Chilo suppressalis TaxID=168631 RepID=A0ABN8B5J0_CHISP|nr:unnamed protein product [Chilo suppressalis]
MGVRGLTTYVNSNQDAFLQYYLLHDTNLVVDGNSMCAQLYRSLNYFSAFGGDYDKYAIYVRNFLRNFRKCNITAFVIFDGSHEARKLKTVYSRLRSKINGASRLDAVTQGSLQIFPLLLRDVFKQVLIEMNIPFTVCEFEADDEIATMARNLKCPVLSYDSDFFIYNVLYVPFNTLERKAKPFYVDGIKILAMECKIYTVQHLTENFGGLKEAMLPLLATLLGNDYVEKKVFNKFFTQLKLPKSKKCKNEQQRCINGIFKWLQNETLDTAISKILGRVKKAHKDKVLVVIKRSIDGYNRKHCRSLKYFNICNDNATNESKEYKLIANIDNDSFDDTVEDSANDDSSEDDTGDSSVEDEIVDDERNQPDWYAEAVRNNFIPQSHLNLFTHHLYFCNPQAEDYTDEDSFLCALPILRYIFDILTDFSFEYCTYVSREKDSNYKRILVEREHSISRPLEVPFQDLSVEQLHMYFQTFIAEKLPSLDLCDIGLLPANFQLYMISIIWWVMKCDVPLSHVHSLFVCYVMLEVIDERTGTFRGHKQFVQNYSKKIEELKKANRKYISDDGDDFFLNKCKVQYEDCLIAANALLKHFDLDESIHRRPKSYDVKKMHNFAQFQCCLLQFNSLNCVCRNPFESTKYHKCFNGTFVYNIALKLENQNDPLKFIEQYLGGSYTVIKFYKSMCAIYAKCSTKMSLINSIKTKYKKPRRRKKKIEDNDDEIINSFLVKGFESEVIVAHLLDIGLPFERVGVSDFPLDLESPFGEVTSTLQEFTDMDFDESLISLRIPQLNNLMKLRKIEGCQMVGNRINPPEISIIQSADSRARTKSPVKEHDNTQVICKWFTRRGLILQTVYFFVALLNDLVGSSEASPRKPPLIRLLKDTLFGLAFTMAVYVAGSFWSIYHFDKELIFPERIAKLFPTWLNHSMHTVVALSILLELLLTNKTYPPRKVGVTVALTFFVSYLVWMHILYERMGAWPYPIFSVLNLPARIVFFIASIAIGLSFYVLGEKLNSFVCPAVTPKKQKEDRKQKIR